MGSEMRSRILLALMLAMAFARCLRLAYASEVADGDIQKDPGTVNLSLEDEEEEVLEPCSCGVFVSGQLNGTRKRGPRRLRRPLPPPRGPPALQYDTDDVCLPCGSQGYKHCVNKCLDEIIKHLNRAGPLVCATQDRDVRRERALLYIRNCEPAWVPTSFSAGKEICCRAGEHVPCNHL